MFEWMKKKEKEIEGAARITLDIHEDGTIYVASQWKTPQNDSERLHYADLLASTIYMLVDGQLTETLQGSVLLNGEKCDQKLFAQQVCEILDVAMSYEEDELVVDPCDCEDNCGQQE